MAPSRLDHMSDELFAALCEAIERESGIVLGREKEPQLARVVQDRAAACRAADASDYAARFLRGDESRQELRALIADLVVGETSFFRNPGQFRALRTIVFPELAAAGAEYPIRVWSAGCATGEEPYSIAIAALEAFRTRYLEPVRIVATDISPGFLAAAREGIYPAQSLRDVPPDVLEAYFDPLPGGAVRVKDAVRRLVTFEEANLADFLGSPPPHPRYDVVFCRNVMIYFRQETIRRLVSRFHESLDAGGVLFLGHSETLWGISDAFLLERREGAYFYRRRAASPAPPAAGPRVPARVPRDPAAPPAPATPSPEGQGQARALLVKAEGLADGGRLGEAERACREAMLADPECPEAPYLMAVVLRRCGRASKALYYARRALASDSRFVMARVEAAECLHLQGKDDEATAEWEEVVRLLGDPVRFPRLSSAVGFTEKSLKAYATTRLRR